MNVPPLLVVIAVAAAALAVAVTPDQGGAAPMPRADDPSTWVWNHPDGPKIDHVEHHVLHSAAMGVDVGYNVYSPPAYSEHGDQRFPVIYFLHGAGGDENSDAAAFSGRVDAAIRRGEMPPVLCVFPNGGLSGYRDRPDRKVMGETLIVDELVPAVDAAYRTRTHGKARVIAGFSMGGGGAVRLTAKHPDLFRAAGSWGGAFSPRFAPDTEDLLREHADEIRKRRDTFLLVVGDQDSRAAHDHLVAEFRELRIPCDYQVLPGVGHNLGLYYERTGDAMLRFLAGALR